MTTLLVSLPQTAYPIQIQSQSLPHFFEYVKILNLGKKVLIVSNHEIFGFYGNNLSQSLTEAGFEVYHHLIPAGEQYKTLETIAEIYNTALINRLERNSTMIALGGGVIGDMTGFAAATWLRGIPFIQIPTSLLAMVDASIGGKTGVNHPQGKNLIGSFYQPKLVYIDPTVLRTLPEREFRAGMAEVIKYGVIWDKTLFAELEKVERLDGLTPIGDSLLTSLITRSCQAKVDVVSQDEKEGGLRAILNYGHTIGHAIESLTGYRNINHGEAVALGMIAVGRLATLMGLWTTTEEQRQFTLIAKAGLPTKIPTTLKTAQILDLLHHDKKVKGGKVRFILPTGIGDVFISDDVDPALIQQAIDEMKE